MPSEAECWEAVQARDARFDGRFVYSVASTGVYCRPSCGSRAKRRENLAFHASPDAAARAGFRACLRCRPDGESVAERRVAAVAAACRAMAGAEDLPDLRAVAEAAGLSRFHFHRVFRSLTGVTPKDYAAAQRAARVRQALAARKPVTEAIYEAGYNASSRFYARAARELGMAPSAYRDGGDGERLRFAIGHASLGAVLVAASERGVAAILLGDDADALPRELERMFPKAELIGGDADFARDVAQVIGFIEGRSPALDLPLDIRGTAFQKRVWDAVAKIPPGCTADYAEIAGAIGRPGAARAVAGACAANKLAVAIPCHRVVRRGGGMAGYRWGVARKRALLEREAQPATPNGGQSRRNRVMPNSEPA